MRSQDRLRQLARLITQDMARGTNTISLSRAGEMVADSGGIPALMACLAAEAQKKRPSEPMFQAYTLLLEAALTCLRLAAQGGTARASAELAEAFEAVEAAVSVRILPPFLIMLIARAVTEAGLEAGAVLEQAMSLALEDSLPDIPTRPDAEALAAHLLPLAEALRHDPFAVYAEFVATGAAFAAHHRAALAAELAGATIPALREAALGFLLEADTTPGNAVLDTLRTGARQNPVTSRLVERLVCLRPWLPPARQAKLDATLRALRVHALPPVPAPRMQVSTLLASPCDGTGSQSIFALLKTGRRFSLASVLIKAGVGVADAWVQGDLSKREADGVTAQITEQSQAVPVQQDFVRLRLADAVATHLARQAPPPFGLLQVTEGLGLGLLRPAATSAEALVAQLLEGQPEGRIGPDATRAAQARSAEWLERFPVLTSWFEGGERVEAQLRPLRTRAARMEAVLTRILPDRRAIWAERCAWMAATLQDSAATTDEAWLDFALVARDLAGAEPPGQLPLLGMIADATVEVFTESERRRGKPARRGR